MRKRDKGKTFWLPQAVLVCAESFQRLAEGYIGRIPFMESIPDVSRIGNDVKEGHEDMPRSIADIVTSATNLAFALELYMKALLACLSGVRVPETHDLWDLYQRIPLEIREKLIEELYNEAIRSSVAKTVTMLKAVHAQLSLSPTDTHYSWFYDEENMVLLMPQEMAAVIDKLNNETANALRYDLRGSITIALGPPQSPTPPKDMNSNKLGEVLKRSKNLFVAWRYIFAPAELHADEYVFHEFEYRSLVFACQALKDTINRLMGRGIGKGEGHT